MPFRNKKAPKVLNSGTPEVSTQLVRMRSQIHDIHNTLTEGILLPAYENMVAVEKHSELIVGVSEHALDPHQCILHVCCPPVYHKAFATNSSIKLPDVTVLMEIFPAREQDTLGVSSNDLVRKIPGAVYCPPGRT